MTKVVIGRREPVLKPCNKLNFCYGVLLSVYSAKNALYTYDY